MHAWEVELGFAWSVSRDFVSVQLCSIILLLQPDLSGRSVLFGQ